MDVAPTIAPTANLSTAFGFISAAFFSPLVGTTIAVAYGGQATALSILNAGGNGAITKAIGFSIGSFNQLGGAVAPTTNIGLEIQAQTAGTNNYDIAFGTVDLTAAGTYYGRVPVLYNGLK
jgi:hypothetical protein